MTTTARQLALEIRNYFEANGIDAAPVVRLKSQEAGLHFLNIVEKENPFITSFVRPNISWVDINGIRFTWPMRESK